MYQISNEMKNKLTRQVIHALLVVFGLALMVAGIITGKHGATVVGLIVAAINFQQWLQWIKKH